MAPAIKGRGTVVTGRVDRGRVKTGEAVEIVGLREKTINSVLQRRKTKSTL